MKPVICIPFHAASADDYRKRAFQKVKEYYSKLNLPIFFGDTSSDSFNRAELRNNAVKSIDCDYDLILFFDADIIVPLNQVQKTIEKAHELNEMVLMYDTLYLVSQRDTEVYYEKNALAGFSAKINQPPSGAFAVPKNIWESVGGQDERFIEWGGEDRAFYLSCAATKSKRVVPRIKGMAYHLFHPRKSRTFKDLKGIKLLQRYRRAVGANERFVVPNEILEDTSKIFSILKEDGGPLSCIKIPKVSKVPQKKEKLKYPNCVVCIPFSSNESWRKKSFEKVYEHYSKLGYNIYIGESDPFTRAASRNGSVPDINFDVIIFVDADIIVPLEQIQKAIAIAYRENELVLAYDEIYFLNEDQTEFFYRNQKVDSTWKKSSDTQISGAFAISKTLWKAVGGYDERFKGWGGEDRAFYYSCAAIKNRLENKRIKGSAYHLFHPRKETANFEFLVHNTLLKRYKTALGLSDKFYCHLEEIPDTKPLLSILNERGGPLNFETEGYLSCPIEILSFLPYSDYKLNEPLIGVTIPCFKSRNTIKRALLSAINQTFKNHVIFVVSDGDLDSFKTIKDDLDCKDNRIVYLRSRKNIGRYAIDHLLCTHILPVFGCTYWAPLDSDDIAEPNWLFELLNKSRQGDYDLVLSDQTVSSPRASKIEQARYWDGTVDKCWHGHLAGLWKLSFVLENNLTNPNYRIGWDSIMTSVAFVLGKVEIVRKSLYTRVKTPNSLTQSKVTGQGSLLRRTVQLKVRNLWAEIVHNKNNPDFIRYLLRQERIKK